MESLLEPISDPGWTLVAHGYDAVHEEIYEARFAISNGFIGVRGGRAVNRGASWIAPQRTFIAGLFDVTGPGNPVPTLVTTPGWLQVRVAASGAPLVHHGAEVALHRATLDMRRGAMFSQCHLTDSVIAARVRALRFVSLAERAIGVHVVELELERGEVTLALEASLEGLDGAPEGAVAALVSERLESESGIWRTRGTGKRLAIAVQSDLQIDGASMASTRPGPFSWSWRWKTRPGQVVTLSWLVALARGDAAENDPERRARETLEAARQRGWRQLFAAHQSAVAARWARSEVSVDGDDDAQHVLRFAVYHLNNAANPDDERVSIGARGLTGQQYNGHVFWDTEIYLLPFYTLTWPEAARAMLMYRFHTIGGARAKAAGMGWRGAMYAWESADTGEETTPDQVVAPDGRILDVLCGRQEQHITADVAYAVWQYWQATRDERFLLDAGAEILLDTGRFWASRAQAEADGYCHIRGVIGPDEYHEHIDDNAFTNVMARWNIRRALDVVAMLRDRWPDHWTVLASRLGLDDAELAHWRTVAETMATGWNSEKGLYEQFAGYFGLEDIDLTAYQGRSAPIDFVLGQKRTQQSQVLKQADVVALLGLLPDEFPGDSGAANFHYYEPRCGHGSSLSAPMHAMTAARLGLSDLALRYFRNSVAGDLSDTDTSSAGGLRMAGLGGTWMTAVLGFAGLSLHDDWLSLNPRLPAGWRSLGFAIEWRGRRLKVRIDNAEKVLHVSLDAGEPMTLSVSGHHRTVHRDQPTACPLEPDS